LVRALSDPPEQAWFRFRKRLDIFGDRLPDPLDVGQRYLFDMVGDLLVQSLDGLCGAVERNGPNRFSPASCIRLYTSRSFSATSWLVILDGLLCNRVKVMPVTGKVQLY
jgi:hypothetical protein